MIAIKRKNGTVIWLDAVLSFSEDYTTSVTKHKVGDGSTISDHTIEENAQFSLDGIVSGVEWNNGPTFGLSDLNSVPDLGEVPQTSLEIIEALQSVNLPAAVGHASVIESLKNPILKLLPESIRQFVDQNASPPDVVLAEAATEDNLEAIKSLLIQLNRGFPTTVNNRVIRLKEPVSILRFDYDWTPLTPILDCICTGLSFKEDAASGDAIYPVMKFEQIRYANIETTVVPEFIVKRLGKQQGSSASVQLGDAKQNPTAIGHGSSPKPQIMQSAAADMAGITDGLEEDQLTGSKFRKAAEKVKL